MTVTSQPPKSILTRMFSVTTEKDAVPAPKPDTATVTFTYTNWRGDVGERTVKPIKIWYGSTHWHPQPQWFLLAWCTEKNAERDFAMVDISNWKNS